MLPRLVLIADRFSEGEVSERVVEAGLAGAPWLVLRDRAAGGESFARAAERLVGRLRALADPPLVSITANLHVAHALQTNLHLGSGDASIIEAVRALDAGAVIGYSAHDVHEAREAAEAGADYLFFSPVFATSSKPGVMGAGIDSLAQVVEAVADVPIFALGGVTPERVRPCLEAGAHGVAVLSGVFGEADPAEAARRYLKEVTAPSL